MHNETYLVLVSTGLSMNFSLQNEKRGCPERVRASVMASEVGPLHPPHGLPLLQFFLPVCSLLLCVVMPISQAGVGTGPELTTA